MTDWLFRDIWTNRGLNLGSDRRRRYPLHFIPAAHCTTPSAR
jgi:hypothetical protein